jgi:hypothetical protein
MLVVYNGVAKFRQAGKSAVFAMYPCSDGGTSPSQHLFPQWTAPCGASRAGAALDAHSERSSSPSWLAPLPFLLELPTAGADPGAVPIPAGQLASGLASARRW